MAQGRLVIDETERLSVDELCLERAFLGLRQTKGIDLRKFALDTGEGFLERYSQPLGKLFDRNFDDRLFVQSLENGAKGLMSRYLQFEGGFLRLTREGILVCDAVSAEFVS